MKGKNKVSGIFATLLLIISIFVVIQFPVPVYAYPGSVEVKVDSADPSDPTKNLTYVYPIDNISNTIVLPVRIRNLTVTPDLVYSWQGSFSFDPKILQCINVGNGSFLWGPYNYTTYSYKYSAPLTVGNIDNTLGTITDVNGTITTPGGSVSSSSISNILAYLNFTVKSFGSTDVNITSIKVLDPTPAEIGVTSVNGSFGMAMPVSLPTKSYWYDIEDIGNTVSMPLSIQTSPATSWGGVTSWQGSFSFDPKILQCINVVNGSFLWGPYNYTTYSYKYSAPLTVGNIDNTLGTITDVNGTITTPGGNVTGSGVLAYLNFTVVNFGSTDVNITSIDVTVGDPHSALVSKGNGHFGMGLEVKFPSTSWTYPPKNIGDTVVMNLTIKAPPLSDSWSGGITSWKANFSYNPAVLNITSVIEGGYLNNSGPTTFDDGTPDYGNGKITNVNCAFTGGQNATGTGVLVSLQFNVTGAGSSDIKITGFWLNGLAGEIPVTPVNGRFSLGATFKLGPNQYWTYPAKTIGDTFDMNLTITAAELSGWQIGLKFNPTVVNVVNIAWGEGFYLNLTGPVVKSSGLNFINNTAGIVTPFACNLLGDLVALATGSDGKVEATITFNVTGPGSTAIELTDAKAFGSEMPVTKTNGYFELGITFTLDMVTSCALTFKPGAPQTTYFLMNLTVNTPELYSWQAAFTFDPTVIQVDSVSGGAGYFLNQSGPVQWIPGTWNNTAGTTTAFGETLLGSNQASGSGTLMSIKFHVIKWTPKVVVRFADFRAFDLDGNNIPVRQVNGVFNAGDVDRNKQVFASDMVQVLIHFGHTPTGTNHPMDWQADIDGNNMVFASDMVIVLIKFGQSTTYPNEP